MAKADTGTLRRFDWTGIAQNGTLLKGEIQATSDIRARIALRQRGITPIKLERPWPVSYTHLTLPTTSRV